MSGPADIFYQANGWKFEYLLRNALYGTEIFTGFAGISNFLATLQRYPKVDLSRVKSC